ncbi:5-formyltetrahydrofolate cyclo-ligase [Lachnospiraceae bacterium KM106-2]|nr:5-formyltetrahydrofolate cyclo-ligase [Lachnospiraceae bacterium KM106-2]
MTKQEVRTKIREEKRKLTTDQIEQLSQRIVTQFLESEQYQNANVVYCYVSYNQEVSTRELINQALADGKKLAVPKVTDRATHEMKFYYIQDMSDLIIGYQGILEPEGKEESLAQENGLMIVPGLAFDLSGNRLGYGGGFYDTYLNNLNRYQLISFAYDFQFFDTIPTEEYDQTIDQLYTPTRKIIFEKRRVATWSI